MRNSFGAQSQVDEVKWIQNLQNIDEEFGSKVRNLKVSPLFKYEYTSINEMKV